MISVVGHTATDHIFLVQNLPERHHSTFILDHKIYYGGGAANIAAGIATLGEEAELVSAVGDDFAGSDYDLWLDELSVKKRFFVVDNARTASCYLYNDESGDQITFFEWGASSEFSNLEAPALDFVHMATADPEFNVHVAEKSDFASFDPGQDLIRYSKEQLESILGNIDVLFANQHEVRDMCAMMGIRKDDLIGMVPLAVFTMSGDGSVLFEGGDVHRIPAINVELADPTGAGDAYRAGFLSAYRRGYVPLTCCKVGTVAASFVVEKVGCQTNLPDWERMKARYSEYFGVL
ncbi:MAG: carbohydrate kinase family protein [Methanogenium sp.]|nr:carbohydrate kinase family protein [Methanogenium sp.]